MYKRGAPGGRGGQGQAQGREHGVGVPEGAGGPGAQGEWMVSSISVNAQVHEICLNLLNVRSDYKQIRDNIDYFCNPPGRAKGRFVEITEKLYGYISQLRVGTCTRFKATIGKTRVW